MDKNQNIIKIKRQEKQLTQGQLAEMLNISRSSVAGYELGLSKPKGEIAKKLSAILDIPLEKII